ncbi:peptidoglycan-binding protein [Nocardiopsis sp. JB363]|uniref:peptidoglycan-binding domain-containing protein n=1 Tax=Nocardiopsis sp. JB363 TaxID=1434837 RepID=UPI00097AF15C|nr:peptidoglycan-binding protein [Nocardiopsis sp. JB363]SIO89290.1 Peptidoglycan-binding domain 1 [Nocardiopsis sp. JB363]
MSEYLTSGIARRAVSLATAGFIAFGGVVMLAPTVSADDYERTPDEVIEQIEARAWPVYSVDQPGPSPDIDAAVYFLNSLDYDLPDDFDPGDEYSEGVAEMVSQFEADAGTIEENGVLETETWVKLRNTLFPTEADAFQIGDEGPAVIAIKFLLNAKFGADLDVTDDVYDEDTAAAVEVAQEESGIGVDGAYGRMTFKCSITKPEVGVPEEKCVDEEALTDEGSVDDEELEPVEESDDEKAPAGHGYY